PVARTLPDRTARSAGNGGNGGNGGDLYVVPGGAATTAPAGDGRFRVSIDVGDPRVLAFTDRPARGADREPLATFVDQWPTVFAGDPPNAALTGTAADGTDSDTAVELTDPAWNPATGQLTLTARPIGADVGAALPGRYTQLSVFIDDATGVAFVVIDIPDDVQPTIAVAPTTPNSFFDPFQPFTWQVIDGPGGGIADLPDSPLPTFGPALLQVATQVGSGTTSLTLGFGQWSYQVSVTFNVGAPPTATVQQLGPADIWQWAPYRMQPAPPSGDPLAAVPVPNSSTGGNVATFDVTLG
ncbi:MAG: hypothetical protein ACOYOP_13840, partial [Microthrixaceae bacterium]